MAEEQVVGEDWQNLTIPNVLGGLSLNTNSESMQLNEFLTLNNLILNKGNITKDTGYVDFADVPGGAPGTIRNVHQHITAGGSATTFGITNLTFLVLANSGANWHGVLVDGGGSTTIDANVSGTDTVIPVAATTNFAVDDTIALRLDDGSDHISTIASVSAGISITIDDALAGVGVVATSGNACIEAVTLAGSNDKHVFALTVPWTDDLVFTNGIDVPYYYDPDSGTVKLVQNLPSSGNTICESIVLFDSSLFLLRTTEGGTNYNNRARWSDRADYTEWVTGEAGYVDMLDSADNIQNAVKLGPHLVVYRNDSITRGVAVNSATRRFKWDTMVTAQGMISPAGYADIGDKHLVVGKNKIYKYKGDFSIEEIGEDIESLLFGFEAEMAEDQGYRLFCVYLKDKNDVLIFYQTGSASYPDKCLRWHGDFGGAWTTREFEDTVQGFGEAVDATSFTWDDLVGTWEDQLWKWSSASLVGTSRTVLLCSSDGQVEEYDYITSDDDGVAKTFTLETQDFAHPNGYFRHDYLELKGSSGEITIYYSTDEGITFNTLETVTIGTTPRKVRIEKQFVGRSVRYRIEGSSSFVLSWYNIRLSLETEY